MANRAAAPLSIVKWQRQTLEAVVRCTSRPHRVVQQAKALLLAADGVANSAIAERLGVSRNTVIGWRDRFEAQGLKEFGKVRAGRGRPPTISDETIADIVHKTLHTTPEGETHWSTRTMAKASGVSHDTVQRIWSTRGIKPHLVHTFKLSNDPRFEEKLVDVVGLYLSPPDKAVVLCVDEKSQIQALDRTQPSLPMKKGRAGTMTHDYKRNGTTTLFAALNVITGVVMGQCLPRHRHNEFLIFLKTINRNVARGLDVHLILDNYGTHKHPKVEAWLAANPRFHLHFTPASSSWLNLVERWFRDLTDEAIRRGVFVSVPDLIGAIEEYLAAHNDDPKPFVWTPRPTPFSRRSAVGESPSSKRSVNNGAG